MNKSTLDDGIPIKKTEKININHEANFLLSHIEHCNSFYKFIINIYTYKMAISFY